MVSLKSLHIETGRGPMRRSLQLLSAVALSLGIACSNALAETLYVSDYVAKDIYKVNAAGVNSIFASGMDAQPYSLAFSPAGQLYVTEFAANEIYRVDSNGTQTGVALAPGAVGLAFDRTGDMFYSDFNNGQIYEIKPGHAAQRYSLGGVMTNPYGLAFDSSGNLFVADNATGAIYCYPKPVGIATQSVPFYFGSAGLHPTYLAFNAAGKLFASCAGDSAIYEFAQNGARNTFTTDISTPYGLAFDHTGDLYVAQYTGDTSIEKFTPNGTMSTFTNGIYPAVDVAFDGGLVNTATPEPGGAALLLGACIVGAGITYRRRRAALQLTLEYGAMQGPAGNFIGPVTGV